VGKKRCMAECEQTGEGREEWTVSPPYLALSQRLSPVDLIFRSPTPTSGKMLLIDFRIS